MLERAEVEKASVSQCMNGRGENENDLIGKFYKMKKKRRKLTWQSISAL